MDARAFFRGWIRDYLRGSLVGLAAGGFFLGAVALHRIDSLQHRMTKLEHACGPVDTGGGVVQCAQPNLYQVKPR